MSARIADTRPPWDLSGNGYVLLYRFDRDFVEQQGWIPPYLEGAFKGGIGSIMLFDYRRSPVGAYQELLFVPGVFQHGNKRYYAVTKIYVSTVDSLTNGREHWAIPKELAEFNIVTHDRTMEFQVAVNGRVFFDAQLTAGVLRFPFNTRVNPFPPRLLQHHDEKGLLTITPQAGGVVSPTAELNHMQVQSQHFPDVSTQRPLGILEAVRLRLYFPKPKMIS